MEDKTLFVLALLFAAAIAGCIGGKSAAPASSAPATQMTAPATVEAQPDAQVGDAAVPFIEENDTVEIGEMI